MQKGSMFISIVAVVGTLLCGAGRAESGDLSPIEHPTAMRVFVEYLGPLGRKLAAKYGNSKVWWCGNARADWCSAKLFSEIRDPKTAAELLEFVNSRLTDWHKVQAQFVPPILYQEVTVRFYHNDKAIEFFGCGQRSFGRSGLERKASREEIGQFLSIIGIEPSELAHPP